MTFTAVVIAAHLPNRSPINLGVLVLEKATDRLYFRFRTDLDGIAAAPDLEVIQGLPEIIESMAVEIGALGVLLYLEDCSSNAIRLGDRVAIHADNAIEAVEREFAKCVA